MFKPLAALLSTVMLLTLPVLPTAASAQQQGPVPIPPLIKLIVPFAAGASTDVIARAIAMQLGPRLGTNVIVENRAGASGMIGTGIVAKGPRDGSQLLFTSVSTISAAATMKSPPLDVTTDIIPLSLIGQTPLLIAASTKTDIKTPADLVAAARANPDGITHGTGGVGTIAHLAAELLNDAAKIQLKHVPYKGAALAVVDMSGGTIDAMLAANTTFASQVKAGRARLVAITSLQPNPAFPGVPPMATAAPGYSIELWTAVFAPAGMPPALVQRLNRELNEIAKSKELTELMSSDGGIPLAATPEEASQRVRESYALWKKLATTKNIVAE